MKKFLVSAVTLSVLLSMGCWSFAFETDFNDLNRFDRTLPSWKLGRGVTNILSGPHEVFAYMANNAINGQYAGAYSEGLHGSLMGGLNGYIGGFFPGMASGLRRMTVGALEILTFWKPEYGPTMDPQYGTRNRAFGTQDYYDSDPFWYSGPTR